MFSETTENILSDKNSIKLEMNHNNIFEKSSNLCKFNNTLQNSPGELNKP